MARCSGRTTTKSSKTRPGSPPALAICGTFVLRLVRGFPDRTLRRPSQNIESLPAAIPPAGCQCVQPFAVRSRMRGLALSAALCGARCRARIRPDRQAGWHRAGQRRRPDRGRPGRHRRHGVQRHHERPRLLLHQQHSSRHRRRCRPATSATSGRIAGCQDTRRGRRSPRTSSCRRPRCNCRT